MKRRAQLVAYIFLLIGIGISLGIIAKIGFDDVGRALAAGGLGVLWVCLWRFVPIALDAMGWLRLFGGEWKPRFYKAFWYRWIGEAVNTLLPVGQLGGDVVRARLAMKDGARGSLAGATSIFDIILSLVSQLMMGMVGFGLILSYSGVKDHVAALSLAMVVAALIVSLVYYLPRLGIISLLGRVASKWSDNSTLQTVNGRAAKVQAAIYDLYRRRRDLMRSMFWRLAGSMAKVVETLILLNILGFDADFTDALIIESLVNLFRSASFVIPAGLGIQEGAVVLFGMVVGLSPDIAIALAVAKRVREAVVGLPALLGWAYMETSFLRRSGRKPIVDRDVSALESLAVPAPQEARESAT